MNIIGQSFVDTSERFFHGMYVSAQGNPFYTGPPADGANPLLAILGPYSLMAIIALVVVLLIIGSYTYLNKKPMPTVSGLHSS
ncbi:MAG: hypothetical protein P1Q69_14300 [Candidatus Thorarchaeota archaeon]|jgi:hypothetical protein|nr:hypothetical protein [Candidatus Thorarchaeota archaeon]